MHIRILASTDLHEDMNAVKRIVKYSPLADVVVVAGDLSNFDRGLRRVLVELNKSKAKVLVIPGNHEDEEDIIENSVDLHNIINIHKSFFMVKDSLFLGYGGSNFTNTDKEFLTIEPYFDKLIKKKNPGKIIFITHNPPFNTKLDDLNGYHIGTKEFSDFIDKEKPDLVICGHLHENFGVTQEIGKTKIINPGKFRIIDLF